EADKLFADTHSLPLGYEYHEEPVLLVNVLEGFQTSSLSGLLLVDYKLQYAGCLIALKLGLLLLKHFYQLFRQPLVYTSNESHGLYKGNRITHSVQLFLECHETYYRYLLVTRRRLK